MVNRNAHTNSQRNNGMIMGGGENTGFSYVGGEMLKQADVATETVLGAANGALTGAMLSAAASAAVSYAQHEGKGVGKLIMKNITSAHLWPVLASTTALSVLGGFVRHSRAVKHNEWSDRHYQFLQQQSKVEKLEAERAQPASSGLQF